MKAAESCVSDNVLFLDDDVSIAAQEIDFMHSVFKVRLNIKTRNGCYIFLARSSQKVPCQCSQAENFLRPTSTFQYNYLSNWYNRFKVGRYEMFDWGTKFGRCARMRWDRLDAKMRQNLSALPCICSCPYNWKTFDRKKLSPATYSICLKYKKLY